jgi:hypothetical protein
MSLPHLGSVGPRISYRLSPYAGITTPRHLDLSSMARPKVHPENRLRANTACTACRTSKKRCSGYFPCTNCIHKGRGGSCTPFKSFAGLRSRPIAVSRPAEAATTWSGSGIGLRSPLRPQTHDAVTPNREAHTPEAGSRSPEATHRTHPRMLRNLQGERGMRPCMKYQCMTCTNGCCSIRWKSRFIVISTITSGHSDPAYRTLTVLP